MPDSRFNPMTPNSILPNNFSLNLLFSNAFARAPISSDITTSDVFPINEISPSLREKNSLSRDIATISSTRNHNFASGIARNMTAQNIFAREILANNEAQSDEFGDEIRGTISFDYAIVRVVPRVERGEFINVGVVLFCSEERFLGARIEVDEARLAAFSPACNLENIAENLSAIPRVCAGGRRAGKLGEMTQRERFHWIVAPRSTVIQTSPTHCGLCENPQLALDILFEKMVTLPRE